MSSLRPIQLGFSLRFQVWYCLVMIVVTAGASGLLYLLMNKSLSGGYLESLRTLYFLDQNLPFYLSVMALLQVFFVLILTLVIVLLVSHQIAGPVFRYEEVLGQICKGEIPKQVATRSTDQLKSTVDSLNELTVSLRGTYQAATELRKMLPVQSEPLHAADAEKVRQQIATVRKRMSNFRAGGGGR